MKVKIGDYVRVFDLPSYKKCCHPKLPIITKVVDVIDILIFVKINGQTFELYEDDGYEAIGL